jgi:hypothetical protein
MAVIFEDREVLRVVWLLGAFLWWGMILLSVLLIRARIDLTPGSLVIRTITAREIAYRDIGSVELLIPPMAGARVAITLRTQRDKVNLCVSEGDAPVFVEELSRRLAR